VIEDPEAFIQISIVENERILTVEGKREISLFPFDIQ
jgi:hypothetical protein